ncbi:HAMP domain-containing histidine kinase [Archangium violaceum]|uniref:sensor histidine kinase n=1 Tax=Archangium violaceum TaxID=83451 RepID=UPI001950378F|nr:HAMP domain-containing sensor histidine kinase [Archangium violaceum]QRN99029.1 HAMP domain-containing histidine kinase [Archangium violaceum]
MNIRRPRFPSRLLWRIYLVGIAQLLLVFFALTTVRRYTREDSFRETFERTSTYNVSEWASLRDRPEELQGALNRVRQRLGVKVTMRTVDGRVFATNISPPLAPISAEKFQRLETERVMKRGTGPPPAMYVAIPETGPMEAYAVVELPPPPQPPPSPVVPIALALGCTAITSLVFARSLAVPLQRLAEVARAFGAGMLDVRTGLRRRDEMGQVAEAFDEMAERITLLLRSQKELLANVSHELRTPLARIRVALDLASEGDAALARESLSDIAEDLSELERLVSDILTAARLDLATGQTPGATPPLRREHVEAQTLVDKAAARFRSARPEHRLEVHVDGTLPALEADPVLLRRAIDNLLDNAGKYSEPHTTVRLHARCTADGLQVEVRDEGIGIDANDLPHLFTPFFRSDRSRARKTGGVGLGLALARRIVVAHGGTLTLESQPGLGTTARVNLPAAPGSGQATGQARAARHIS